MEGDGIKGGHGKAGPIDDAADIAVKGNIVKAVT